LTNKTAANRYARALLDVAVKERADLDRIDTDLTAFASLFTAHPTLGRILLNPAVPTPRKRAAVAELVGHGRFAPIVAKLLVLLAERDRLVLVPDIVAAYRDRLMDHRHVVRAEVTTAAPIDQARARALADSLTTATGRTVALTTHVDPGIIGGVVARVGSTVYDASVARQLERMRQQLEGAS
jgi:F-type H+-transporting ATPase subunit delta